MARKSNVLRISGVLVLPLLVGCMSDPACERQIALMRAELLDLEDRYALLQAQYEDSGGDCESGVESDGPLKRLLEPPKRSEPNRSAPKSGDDIQIELDPKDLSSGVQFRAPPIGRGSSFDDPNNAEIRSNDSDSGDILTVDYEQPVLEAAGEPAGLASILAEESPLMQLQVVAAGMASPQADGGVDGLELLVIPVDAEGFPRWRPGDLSIAVIDPAMEDPGRRRIGTWHFTWEELAGKPGDADRLPRDAPLRLPLTWNLGAPQHSTLQLFVRFRPRTGEPLQTEQRIHLERLPREADSGELEQKLAHLIGESSLSSPDAPDESRVGDLPLWEPVR